MCDVTADDSRLIFTRSQVSGAQTGETADLVRVENWFTELGALGRRRP